MTGKETVVAVDVGTTATKALVVRRDGRVLARAAVEYPLHTPEPGAAEQNPDELLEAIVRAVRRALESAGAAARDVAALSFSSAMHGLIAFDGDGRPLTSCITWADTRAAPYAAMLRDRPEGAALYTRTGTPLHPMSPLVKLMWLRDRRPDVVERASMFAGVKEYALFRLYGRWVVDQSLASATGLFELRRLDWDGEALRLSGVERARLPEPVPATAVLEGLDPEYARAMGLSPDVPAVVGASDGTLANLGVGAVRPGVVAVTIGTSGAVRGVAGEPVVDPKGRLFCYALVPGMWVVGGPINNGGVALRWARDCLAFAAAREAYRDGVDPYERMTDVAAQAPPGAGGLLFLPFLTGERAPVWDADARGVLFGLDIRHGLPHVLRAVMEGVVFAVRSVAGALAELAGPLREVRATGGFARSPLWRQMLADALGVPVTVTDTVEGSAVGAAKLAFVALGLAASFDELDGWAQPVVRHEPDARIHRLYEQLTSVYLDVYHQLKGLFPALAPFRAADADAGNGAGGTTG